MERMIRTLAGIARAASDSAEVIEPAAFAAWKLACGEGVSRNTAPLGLEGGCLRIAVSDRAWKRELTAASSALIYRINAALGCSVVKRLDFVTDERVAGPAIGKPVSEKSREEFEAEAKRGLARSVVEAADAIHDPELRQKFLVTAGLNLQRGKRTASR